jgi:hypothetical protein
MDHKDFLDKIDVLLKMMMKKAIEAGVAYVKEAGRKTLTSDDIRYGLMYEAHEFLFRPEFENDFKNNWENSESESESDTSDASSSETEEVFTRAINSNNKKIEKMNYYADTWESWTPDDEIQQLLKKSIDN